MLHLDPLHRNANRAYLTWLAKYGEKSSMIEEVIKTFDLHSRQRACFGDLKEFLPQLSHQDEARFLNHIDHAAKLNSPYTKGGHQEIDKVSVSSVNSEYHSYSVTEGGHRLGCNQHKCLKI